MYTDVDDGASERRLLPSACPSLSIPDADMSFEGDAEMENAELAIDIGQLNSFDADVDWVDMEEEASEFLGLVTESAALVPQPPVAMHISSRQDVAEYYSPPRVLPVARRSFGLSGVLSLDVVSGWDFNEKFNREVSLQCLAFVLMLILCPPCTIFSVLQRLWNFKRMDRELMARRWSEGMLHLEHSMQCARAQILSNTFLSLSTRLEPQAGNKNVFARSNECRMYIRSRSTSACLVCSQKCVGRTCANAPHYSPIRISCSLLFHTAFAIGPTSM